MGENLEKVGKGPIRWKLEVEKQRVVEEKKKHVRYSGLVRNTGDKRHSREREGQGGRGEEKRK